MIAASSSPLIIAAHQAVAQAAGTPDDATGYIVAAWVVTLGAIGAYAAAIVRRGRKLSRDVPPEDRRWM